MLKRLAAPAVSVLALVCALTGALPAHDARASATAVAVIACENLAPYLDGDPTDATTPADEQAACLDPIPPTGPLSIASLELAAGDGDGVLTWTELNPIDFLDHNRIDETCTYEAVITLATKPAVGCTLLALIFVDDEFPVRLSMETGLATMEGGVGSQYTCLNEGAALGQDADCSDVPDLNGDGVVVFHVLNGTAQTGDVRRMNGGQESVEYGSDLQIVRISPGSRNDPDAVSDPDEDGVDASVDNCQMSNNPDQLNTDSDPIATAGVAVLDVTVVNGDSLGDACEGDTDNDGIGDFIERYIGCSGHQTSPLL
ncbi:MAG: hypothetical protein HY873_04090, partial [Chloroflexi bacterium]|nr:hypothetical protein [Chloroflexota bacterium]